MLDFAVQHSGQRVRSAATIMAALLTFGACGSGSDTVAAPVAATVTLTAGSTGALVSIGDTRTITAVVLDTKSAPIASPSLTWTTSNAQVATVAGTGSSAVVTATGNGSATISAISGTVSATVMVDVAQKFAALTLTAPSAALGTGGTAQLTPVARDARGVAITGTIKPTYTTSARSAALVDTTGLVTAIAPGTATMTATLTRDGVTANGTAVVTVTPPAAGVLAASVQATNTNLFTPATTTVTESGTVTWAFGSVEHNVIFQSAAAPANIPLTSNASAARTFATLGSYAYVCSIHAGMSGTINVVGASLFSQMNGANERPNPVTSTANGSAVFTRSGNTVTYTVAYQGLTGNTTGLHIHAPANAATATGVAIDLLKTTVLGSNGVLTGTFTGSDIRSVAGQPAVSLDSMMVLIRTGNAYVNVHSTSFPGGEIRGQTGTP